MIDEELLLDLREGSGFTTLRPLGEISRRARTLRRHRTWRRSGVALGMSALSLVVIGPILRDGTESTRVEPSATEQNSGKDCTSGSTQTLSLKDVAALLYLPSAQLAGTRRGEPLAREDRPTCSAPTTGGYWYSTAQDGRVTRVFFVAGPAQTDYYAKPGGPEMGDGKRYTVNVGDQQGTLYYSAPARLGRLFWSLPDGSSWAADGMGMTRKEIVTAAASLTIADQEVDAAAVPTGLGQAVPTTQLPAGLRRGLWFDVTFGEDLGSAKSGAANTGVELQVSTDQVPPAGPNVGNRSVEIRDRQGWIAMEGGSVSIVWSPAPGVNAFLTDEGSREHALAVARSVVKVSPDDPRLG